MTKEWGKGLRRTPHTLLPTKVCSNMYSCETNRQLYTKYIQRTTTGNYGPEQFRQSTSSCVLLRLTDLSGGGMPHLQRAVIRSTDNSVAMELQTCHLWWKCRGGGLAANEHMHMLHLFKFHGAHTDSQHVRRVPSAPSPALACPPSS